MAVESRKRLLDLLLPLPTEETMERALWYAFKWDPKARRRLLDLVMSTEDPVLFDYCKGFFVPCREADLLAEVVSAYSSESNPDRRDMLAFILGGNFEYPSVQPLVEDAMRGSNSRVLEQVLQEITLLKIGADKDLSARTAGRLRDLSMGGTNRGIRLAATKALVGDFTEEGIRFLIDRLMNDADPAIQLAALESIPNVQVTRLPLAPERQAAFWNVAQDGHRDARLRLLASKQLLNAADEGKMIITDDQRRILESLVD
jgi:hypothetical protein